MVMMIPLNIVDLGTVDNDIGILELHKHDGGGSRARVAVMQLNSMGRFAGLSESAFGK